MLAQVVFLNPTFKPSSWDFSSKKANRKLIMAEANKIRTKVSYAMEKNCHEDAAI